MVYSTSSSVVKRPIPNLHSTPCININTTQQHCTIYEPDGRVCQVFICSYSSENIGRFERCRGTCTAVEGKSVLFLACHTILELFYLPEDKATFFMAMSKLSPSTKAKDKFTQPTHTNYGRTCHSIISSIPSYVCSGSPFLIT